MNIRPIVFVAMLIGLSSTSAPAFNLNKLQEGLGGMMKQLEQKKDTQQAPPQAVPNPKRQEAANCSRQAALHAARIEKNFVKYYNISKCMADKNIAFGYHGLAYCAKTGRCGHPKNRQRAIQLYTKAANMGYEKSAKALRKMKPQQAATGNHKPHRCSAEGGYRHYSDPRLAEKERICHAERRRKEAAAGKERKRKEAAATKRKRQQAAKKAKAAKAAESVKAAKTLSVWKKYSSREKTLPESVLNYTNTGKTEGSAAVFWLADKKNSCFLTVYGSATELQQMMGVMGKAIDIRKINQTAFRISHEYKQPSMFLGKAWYYIIKSGPLVYFNIAASLLDRSRVQKAWRLLFAECPGKKSRF